MKIEIATCFNCNSKTKKNEDNRTKLQLEQPWTNYEQSSREMLEKNQGGLKKKIF